MEKKDKLGIIFRIAVGLMIAMSSVLPSFGNSITETVKLVPFWMAMDGIGTSFIWHIGKYFYIFAIAGLVGALLFASAFGRSGFRGWLTALCFFILCQLLGFMAQIAVEFSYEGLGALSAGFFTGPFIAASEQLGSVIANHL